MKSVELEQEQLDLVIRVLLEKQNDLDGLLNHQEGLGAETIRDISLEARNVRNIIRELRHFTVSK